MEASTLPGGLAPTVGSWIDALSTITALDFEHALTGHALSGTRQDALQSLQYLRDISKGVAAGVAAGRPLAEIQKTLTLDAYKGHSGSLRLSVLIVVPRAARETPLGVNTRG